MSKCKDCKWYEPHCSEEYIKHRQKQTHKKFKDSVCNECTVDSIRCDEGGHGFCCRYPPYVETDGIYIPITVGNDGGCGEFKAKGD